MFLIFLLSDFMLFILFFRHSCHYDDNLSPRLGGLEMGCQLAKRTAHTLFMHL